MPELRSDFRRLEIVHTDELSWEPSPSKGVWRKRLELSGPVEAGRVTSVVRYDAGSRFPAHGHPQGEEILVLEGTLSDEHGDYRSGSYLLNPEGFEHAPFSEEGCVLFVKLRQYPGKREHSFVDTRKAAFTPHRIHGVEQLSLYRSRDFPERIHLTRIAPGAVIGEVPLPDGEEIFVLRGAFFDEHGEYRKGSWIRYPAKSSHTPRSPGGCLLYVKQGHLAMRFA